MIEANEYSRNFAPHALPTVLAKLIQFDGKSQEFFSDGFEFTTDGDKVGFTTYSDRPEFLASLFHIGQASASGSDYALWLATGTLEAAPVVIFGDEGGVHPVARDLIGLLSILSFDADRVFQFPAFIR